MTAESSPRRLWWLLVALATGYFAFFAFFPSLLWYVGVSHYGVWFLDTYAILASNDVLGIGRDAYAYNPLDPLGRPHVYSHWWLHLRDLGLTRAQNFQVGAAFALAFFGAAIARLRPREPREVLWYFIVLCASPMLLAINRGNNDLVVFALLAPVVPCLLAPQRGTQVLAILLIAFATGLKFYPAVAGLVLLAGADTREVRRRVLGGVLALALVGLELMHDVALRGGNAPKADGLMTFGAADVFHAARTSGAGAVIAWLSVVTFAVVVFSGVRSFKGWAIPPHDREMWWSFILGAAVLAGCFFAGTNFGYRWIFAIWLAPLLWRLPRDLTAPVRVRRLAKGTAILLVIGLWADPIVSTLLTVLRNRVPTETVGVMAERYFFAEQPFTWALFGCLVAFLVHFTRRGLGVLFARE